MKAGVVLIDKAPGISSATVVAKLRRRLAGVKAGHCGTLDPMATGLLVCVVGNATRLASYAQSGRKIYSGTLIFGVTTDSDDCTGNILSQSQSIPEFEAVQEVVDRFVGTIEQRPPSVSAINVNGKRAYQLARAGQEFELKSRSIEIYSLSVKPLGRRQIAFRMECSKGTYVRSFARDLGLLLGCGACLTSLRREFSAPFSIKMAKDVDFVSESDILDPQVLFPGVELLTVQEEEAARLAVGDERIIFDLVARTKKEADSDLILYGQDSPPRCLGLLVRRDSRWRFGVNLNAK